MLLFLAWPQPAFGKHDRSPLRSYLLSYLAFNYSISLFLKDFSHRFFLLNLPRDLEQLELVCNRFFFVYIIYFIKKKINEDEDVPNIVCAPQCFLLWYLTV